MPINQGNYMAAAKATMALAFIAGIRTADSQGPRPASSALTPVDTVDAAPWLSFGTPTNTGSSVSGDRQLLALSPNETKMGFVIKVASDTRVFLLGAAPPPDCEPTVRGEYGNVTQGTLNMICPEDNGTLTARNTYHFSQDPNHTYLERGPRDTVASLCTMGLFDPFNPPDSSGIFEGTELIQPWSMFQFAYADKCNTNSPTSSPGRGLTSAPTPTTSDTCSDKVQDGKWALTAIAGVGLAGSLLICAYRGRLQCSRAQVHQIHPEASIEMGVQVSSPAPLGD